MEQKNTQGGVFIALESADEPYKNQVFDAIKDKLVREGYDVTVLKFPCLSESSGYFVSQYLRGNYDQVRSVSPYAASLFYALDRYEMAAQIERVVSGNGIVLATGFSGDTISRLGVGFAKPEERRGYFIWNDSVEHEILGTPRPSKSFVLNTIVSLEKDRQLAKNGSTLPSVSQVYQDVCSLFTKDFQLLDCVRNGRNLDIKDTGDVLWRMLQPLLPTPPVSTKRPSQPKSSKKTKTTFEAGHYIPTSLDGNMLAIYNEAITKIVSLGAQLASELTNYLASNTGAIESWRLSESGWSIDELVQNAVKPTIPIAVVFGKDLAKTSSADTDDPLRQLAKQYLEDGYGNNAGPAKLTEVWPRNEMELVPDILYEHSSLSLDEIIAQVEKWSYDKKAAILAAAYDESVNRPDLETAALGKIRYSWDILCDASIFMDLASTLKNHGLRRQALTPRYGYDMPALIEEAGLIDEFEECFDISLRLHSELQAAGFKSEAEYAVLLGHKLRVQLTHNGNQLVDLWGLDYKDRQLWGRAQLFSIMREKIYEIHPILAETLKFVRNKNLSKAG